MYIFENMRENVGLKPSFFEEDCISIVMMIWNGKVILTALVPLLLVEKLVNSGYICMYRVQHSPVIKRPFSYTISLRSVSLTEQPLS